MPATPARAAGKAYAHLHLAQASGGWISGVSAAPVRSSLGQNKTPAIKASGDRCDCRSGLAQCCEFLQF
jgi:hypothetical protein